MGYMHQSTFVSFVALSSLKNIHGLPALAKT